VIDAVLTVRAAGYPIRSFGGLTYAKAKSRIARVVIAGHDKMMAESANIAHRENHIGGKLTFDRKIDVFLVRSLGDWKWIGLAADRLIVGPVDRSRIDRRNREPLP